MKYVMTAVAVALIMVLATSFDAACLDDATYAQYVADSAIELHKVKGRRDAMELWMKAISAKYPDYMSGEWQALGDRIKQDPALRASVYEKALSIVRSAGYGCALRDRGDGVSVLEIAE
jgi:hypothetical protein